jgi:WD40 repeat protein
MLRISRDKHSTFVLLFQQAGSLKGHSAPIWCVAFSPDGQRIVTGSWDQTAKVWEAASGRVLLSSLL